MELDYEQLATEQARLNKAFDVLFEAVVSEPEQHYEANTN